MDIYNLLKCWGYWLKSVKFKDKKYPQLATSRINQMMAGKIEKGYCPPHFRSMVLAGVEFNGESDKLYSVVDQAIAKLPKRRREAVMIEFYYCVNGTQEQKCRYMNPEVKQNTYSELLKFALNQLSNMPDVKAMLK